MELFHPRAVRVLPTNSRPQSRFIGVPTKVVIHTTESDHYTPDPSSYFGHQFWPHATIFKSTIFQHFPINKSVFALAHDVAPETNLANAIQCEVVHRTEARGPDGKGTGKPTDPKLWTDELLTTLADWLSWVCEQTATPVRFAEMFQEGVVVASINSPIRFRTNDWLQFHGICGHSNVPGGNVHWDPGRLPVERLQPLLGRRFGPDTPLLPKESPDMFIADIEGLEHPQLIGAGWRKAIRSGKTATALLEGGVKHLGRLDPSVGSDLIDLESVPAALTGIKAAVTGGT